jgi:hypothetical protein
LFVKALPVIIAWTLSSFIEKMYQITHRILAGRMAHICQTVTVYSTSFTAFVI